MKRLIFLILFITAFTLPLAPASVPAQDFGLEDGDGAAVLLPGEAKAAQPEEPESTGASALVLAAPGRVGVGQPFIVRLTSDLPLGNVTVYWQGKEVVPSISVWNDRHIALAMLGTDVLSAKPGKEELSVIASIDGKENTFRRTVQLTPKSYPKQELTLPEKMVTPPAEVYDKINQDRAEVAVALDTTSPQRIWRLPFYRPVDGKITSLYGLQRILNGKPKNPHRGLDFRAPMGTPIHAVADGTVILVGDHYYAGNSIYIDHGNGVVSMYFHSSEVVVKEGDRVDRGQVIAKAGKSGRATGPHLHLSVAILGKLVDPEPLFKTDIDNLLK